MSETPITPSASEAPLSGPFSAAAFVPYGLEARLHIVAPGTLLCNSAEEALDVMRSSAVRLFIGDPSHDTGRGGDVMRLIRTAYPSSLVVAYIALTPEAVTHLVRIAPHGITECVIYGHDDTVRRFAALMTRARVFTFVRSMLDELAPELDRLGASWRDAVSDVYRRPMRFRFTADLAATMNTTRQTVHRRLLNAGLRSPRLLVGSGRVLRATELLRDPSRTLRCTAEQLGYHRPEHLTNAIRLLTGLRVRALRAGADESAITSAIAHRLRSGEYDLENASN